MRNLGRVGEVRVPVNPGGDGRPQHLFQIRRKRTVKRASGVAGVARAGDARRVVSDHQTAHAGALRFDEPVPQPFRIDTVQVIINRRPAALQVRNASKILDETRDVRSVFVIDVAPQRAS